MITDPAQKPTAQFVRFLAVGLFVFAADAVIYWLLVEEHAISIFWANLAAKLCGAVLGFVMHKFVTFSWQQASRGSTQFGKYILLWFMNVAAANMILFVGTSLLALPHFPVKIFGDIVIVASSFLIGRFFIFHKKVGGENNQ